MSMSIIYFIEFKYFFSLKFDVSNFWKTQSFVYPKLMISTKYVSVNKISKMIWLLLICF